MSNQTSAAAQSGHVTTRVARTDSRFHRNYSGLLASLGCAAFLLASAPALAQVLGAAQSFAILGGTAVTATAPATIINGDVGIAPGAASAITGFPANVTILAPFVNHGNDAVAIAARASTLSLFNSLNTMGGATVILPGLNGQTLVPGTYSTGTATLTSGTPLILNGAGTYIFQLGSLTTDVGSSVTLIGVNPCNVFWQVDTLAALNGTTFPGNIVAGTGVHLVTAGASLIGRALVQAAGDVTMAGSNNVGGCSAAKLTLQKTVNGGSATVADFPLTATGDSSTGLTTITGISGTAAVTAANAPVGGYTLTEIPFAGYTAGSFICSNNSVALSGSPPVLTIAAADLGNTITCTVINTYTPNPAKLALVKTVVNTGGGTALASAFTLTATGPVTISGAAPVAATNALAGDYTLTETNLTGYTAGSFSCIGGGSLSSNILTIGAGDAGKTITCTITNTFASVTLPTMRVTKVSNGGVGLFNFTGSNGFASQNITTATTGVGVAGATQTLTAAGVSTTITESTPPTGYTLASIACTGLGTDGIQTPNIGTRSVALDAAATAAGAAIACTFTNTFNVPVAATAIPTLSEWAMIVLAAFMAITGFVAMRRKER